MGTSLLGMLHRRYGRRATGKERTIHAKIFQDRMHALDLSEIFSSKATINSTPLNVGIVGAGLAGCCAANLIWRCNNNNKITLFDANANPGGRVYSAGAGPNSAIITNRITEVGAELIGLNHPFWLMFASYYGMGLGVVTPEDDFALALLDVPLVLNGTTYDYLQAENLYEEMADIFAGWKGQYTPIYNNAPWTNPDAAKLDGESLGQNIGNSGSVAEYAMQIQFEMNNLADASQQSWLANLAQFKAGTTGLFNDGMDFFDYSETFRCTAGNQTLAFKLLSEAGVSVTNQKITTITTTDNSCTVTYDNSSGTPVSTTFDVLIVATSLDAWAGMTVNGGAFPYTATSHGTAVKYFAQSSSRFWLPNLMSPNSMSDQIGMTWEGTDNQMDNGQQNFNISVFSGGQWGTAAQNDPNGPNDYYYNRLTNLYTGYNINTDYQGSFSPDILTNVPNGYSCPTLNQVTGLMQYYGTQYQNSPRLFVAGEHTSPSWFGFMEGALESAFYAVRNVMKSVA